MIIEVCAGSVESALNAEKGGADRIELCSELEVGGITPSYGIIKQVIEQLSIPVFVLIRPRSGNFTYSNTEFEVMKEDVRFCKEMGCKGIVSGVLLPDNTLDVERTKELMESAQPLSFTFHRAFDWVPNPEIAIKKLIGLGCERILTSGQEKTAEQGLGMLVKLQQAYGSKIKIMPGSGIREGNILEFKKAGFSEIHFSASKNHQILNKKPPFSFNANLYDERYVKHSHTTHIERMVSLVK